MSAPPLRRDRLRRGYRGTDYRWWSHRRGNSGAGHQHRDRQPTRHERQNQRPHGNPLAAGLPLGRAGHPCRTLARRLALAGIRPAVEARAGDGSRRVRSALGIRANAEAAHADGSPDAGLGQVQPKWPKFDALTKSPCHTLPSVPPEAHRGSWSRRSVGSHSGSTRGRGHSTGKQPAPEQRRPARRTSAAPWPFPIHKRRGIPPGGHRSAMGLARKQRGSGGRNVVGTVGTFVGSTCLRGLVAPCWLPTV
jgi:hypothetical protein